MDTYGGMNHEPLFASSHSTRPIQIMMKTIVSVPKNVFLQLPFSVKLNIFTYIFLKIASKENIVVTVKTVQTEFI